jgi:hypothetical protein
MVVKKTFRLREVFFGTPLMPPTVFRNIIMTSGIKPQGLFRTKPPHLQDQSVVAANMGEYSSAGGRQNGFQFNRQRRHPPVCISPSLSIPNVHGYFLAS